MCKRNAIFFMSKVNLNKGRELKEFVYNKNLFNFIVMI